MGTVKRGNDSFLQSLHIFLIFLANYRDVKGV